MNDAEPDGEDDDRTIIRPLPTPTMTDTHALPVGTRLEEFEIRAKVGEGGFSIVYEAWDHSLQRRVALKEYMPSALASRTGAATVAARSDRHRETFAAGLKSFVNEGRLLAQFDHPALVKVHRFWEAHGTAYMAMPLYHGATLKDTVRALAAPPNEVWLRTLLAPLTEALEVIHSESCFHRDVAPDNVMLLAGSGRPLLLDFGAARRVIGDMTQALTVILKPGYAPIEQYADMPDLKQGPWTDVYALAAVVYWCITGRTPPPSVGRMMRDNYEPLAKLAAGRYDQAFLAAIDRALIAHPEQRTHSIEQFRVELALERAIDVDTALLAGAVARDRQALATDPLPSASPSNGRRVDSGLATVVGVPPVQTRPRAAQGGAALVAGPTEAAPEAIQDHGHSSQSPQSSTTDTARRRRTKSVPPDADNRWRRPIIATVSLALVAAAAVAWVIGGGGDQAPDSSPQPSRVDTPPAGAPVVGANQLPATPSPRPAPTAAPSSLAGTLADLVAASDPTVAAEVRLSSAQGTAGGTQPTIDVRAPAAGLLFVFAYRDGEDDLLMLAPGLGQEPRAIDAGRSVRLTAADWRVDALVPGSWQLIVLVAREPMDMSADVWRMQGQVRVRSFGRDTSRGTATRFVSAAEALVGPVLCTTTRDCVQVYGASVLSLQVAAAPALASPPTPVTTPNVAPAVSPRSPRAASDSSSRSASADCAALLQRMSLGEDSAALRARFRELDCR